MNKHKDNKNTIGVIVDNELAHKIDYLRGNLLISGHSRVTRAQCARIALTYFFQNDLSQQQDIFKSISATIEEHLPHSE